MSRFFQVTVRWPSSCLRWLASVAVVLALFGVSCAAAPPSSDMRTHTSGQSLAYRFPLPDGSSVGTSDHLGRWTIILFLTTYDTVSQAIVLRLDEYQHTRTPRINVLAVALEPPQNAPLVAVYRETLAVGYHVALADQETLDGRGPFGDVRAVPTLVLLDQQSRMVRRGVGVAALAEIESALDPSARKAE